MKLLKDAEGRGAGQARPRRPRALVLGPTRELTDQILGVAKSISHHAKFRSACVNGGVQLSVGLAHSMNTDGEAAIRQTECFRMRHFRENRDGASSGVACSASLPGLHPALVCCGRQQLRRDGRGVAAPTARHSSPEAGACRMHAGGAPGQQAEALAQPLDILVGTPQKVVQHAEKARPRPTSSLYGTTCAHRAAPQHNTRRGATPSHPHLWET